MANLRYSIKDLENFTQIKAHTIRIWEQRYGLLIPKRTDTNIRYYSEDDLKKILNVNLLYTSGYKISKIAQLSEEEIIEESKSLILVTEVDKQSEIDALTMLILDFKGSEIKEVLDLELATNKLEDVYEKMVLPLLKKIGQLWQVNSINIIHEHYFSTIFREFLIANIESIKTKRDPLKRALLFLHDNEEHEFAILIYYYLLRQNGYDCHYFGQNVPVKEINSAFTQINPQLVVSTFTAKISEKNFKKIETVLLEMSKKSQVIVS
ncbi:MAG: DNA-binding transcriptional MerR regulator, partial [Crocinitomicaceae bacterium]